MSIVRTSAAMRQVCNLIVLMLAIVSVGTGVDSRRSLYEYCRGLSKSISTNNAVYSDAQVAFKEAKSRLKSIKNFGSERRQKLATAWEAVIEEGAECNSKSAQYVWTIVECAPEKDREMVTLDRAMRDYGTKCLGPNFWDKMLQKTLGARDESGLSTLMNHQYIAKYQEENPSEPAVHFGTIEGKNCCRPERSVSALLGALNLLVWRDEGRLFANPDIDELGRLMREHLFNPCVKYINLVDNLMIRAEETAKSHPGGQQTFIQGLSLAFRNAIFRYKYCSHFRFLFDD